MFVVTVDKNTYLHLVVVFVHDDLAEAAIVSAERNPKLELADVAFPEPERVTEPLRVPVRTGGPLHEPLVVYVSLPPEPWLAIFVYRRKPPPTGVTQWLRAIGGFWRRRGVHTVNCASLARVGQPETMRFCTSVAGLEQGRHTSGTESHSRRLHLTYHRAATS